MTFNQVVRGSNPRTLRMKNSGNSSTARVSAVLINMVFLQNRRVDKEHLTFNQVVRGSNPRTLRMKNSGNSSTARVSAVLINMVFLQNRRVDKW